MTGYARGNIDPRAGNLALAPYYYGHFPERGNKFSPKFFLQARRMRTVSHFANNI